jgi:hypothetical protein
MTKTRRSSIRKRGKAALALGAAGVSLAMTGAAPATAPTTTTNEPSQDNARRFILVEEEISDVSLATFHVFDRENPPLNQDIRVARGGGCGGGGGCGHGGGCGGCAHAGGGCAVGGCAVGGRCAVGGCAVGGRCAIGGGCAVVGRCAVGGRCAIVGRCACRGGCACFGAWIGVACLGCAGCSGTCWQWDPYLGQWVSICY